ncbi:hypothetical protein BZB76_0147 [Actinomadura pelletieri DSM 43383]|uniref:Ig-like domain-containing protein n=1 Tax=Actinomadura pelletieri DSM 43383 TaxID=1120940 RepID=A0A495QX00_9ACTN|nr:hypothetical protein [Actinomadura pelletieri]RKS78719.1 hypothetical protein BZB76_0147 [Actinomadura pelletieri DSM 43383]
MSRIIRSGLATAMLSTAVTGIVLSSGPAQARACFLSIELEHFNGSVVGARSRYCEPPGVDNPLPTTIQRKSGTSWVNVTATGTGGAAYKCVGTSSRTYRLKETPTAVKTFPCS